MTKKIVVVGIFKGKNNKLFIIDKDFKKKNTNKLNSKELELK